ncbi:MAG: hypothetical protein ACT4OS_01870 [Acidimicrobiales bacterium]
MRDLGGVGVGLAGLTLALALAACGAPEVDAVGSLGRPAPDPTATTSTAPETTTPATSTTVSPAPTAERPTAPAANRPPTTAVTVPPATPTTSAPALSRAEANSRLCGQIEYADEAVTRGSFIAGGLRLAAGISDYAEVAEPALVQLARQMLESGKAGDADGYVATRSQAVTLCEQLGRPIRVGGIQCVTTPCP